MNISKQIEEYIAGRRSDKEVVVEINETVRFVKYDGKDNLVDKYIGQTGGIVRHGEVFHVVQFEDGREIRLSEEHGEIKSLKDAEGTKRVKELHEKKKAATK